MHLNLHKKAYKKVLLIANGYEPYHDDISYLADSVHYIDPYSQDKNYIQSLETFKKYLEDNNLDNESLVCKTKCWLHKVKSLNF